MYSLSFKYDVTLSDLNKKEDDEMRRYDKISTVTYKSWTVYNIKYLFLFHASIRCV